MKVAIRVLIKKWILVLGCLCSFEITAVEVQGLYNVELVVKSQSADDRVLALKQALYAVLNRVVVADNIAQLAVVQNMLQNPGNYLKQFQYADLSADQQELNTLQGPRKMNIEFDEEQILKALQGGQVAIWDEVRPATLLWIVVNEDGEQQFYNSDMMPNFEAELALASKVKGLPFIYPLLDLDEQQQLSATNLTRLDAQTIIKLSSRYEAISVAVISFTKHDNCWQGSWSLYFDGQKTDWSGVCQPLRLSMLAGADKVYQVLSNYYAARPSARH